jgi:enoyl-CoA hydratase/carnithine racemase/carbon monoxide dehydrogenase subunit G
MEMNGEARLLASRQFVWDALNNPSVLKASIPGCEAMDVTGESEYTATVVSKVGPIKARFTGKVTLSNIVAPKSYTLTGEGSGGAAGFARADIEVSLEALEEKVTLLKYMVKANVGGKLAQLGSRMIDATARKSADDFFESFSRQVESLQAESGVAPSLAVSLGDLNGDRVEIPPSSPDFGVDKTQYVPLQGGGASALQDMKLSSADSAAAAADVMTSELIKVWIADQVAVITINRPKSRNAMTLAMWSALPSILSALERNHDVRAVILTGSGEDFSAGADISEFEKVRADIEQATAYEVAVDACCDAIFNFSKPTIAVLRGYCLGGGAHLAMSCDFRYAEEKAIFGIPAAKLSIIYGVRGTRKLLSLVGLTEAKKIMLGAQRFDAVKALQIGFIDHIAISRPASKISLWERLLGARSKAVIGDPMVSAREFAQLMAENAPLSMAGAKSQLNGMSRGTGALDLNDAEILIAEAAGSEDYREGRQAFATKRKPNFQCR